MYYIFIIISAILFSLQFLCQQKYQEKVGTGFNAALSFSFYKGIAIIIMMLVISRFKIQFSVFSFVLALIYASCYILMAFYSLKAFSIANLSVYSVFAMLGGMLLPFVSGIVFYNEELTVFKILCCLLIVVAVLLNIQKGKSGKKAFIYYMLVFLLNGTVAVLSKVHQASNLAPVNSTNFMFYSGVFTVLICGICLLIKGKRFPCSGFKEIVYSAGDGVLNGVGDLLLFVSLLHLPASVQYPIVTGGVMVFSTLISVIRHEKLRKLEYVAAAIAFLSSLLIVF